jgi:hypothetical protein
VRLTPDSTWRTLPELKRAGQEREHLTDPNHSPPGKGQIVATDLITTTDRASQAGTA